METDAYLDVLRHSHGKALIELDGLLVILNKQEFITPVQGNIVQKCDEVKNWQATTVSESNVKLMQKVRVKCGSINLRSRIKCFDIFLHNTLRVTFFYLRFELFLVASISILFKLLLSILNEQVEMRLESLQEH